MQMAVYIVTYDIDVKSKNYHAVVQAIKNASTGIWYSYWKSSWLIQSPLSADGVYSKIQPFLNISDHVFVIEVKKNYQGLLSCSEDWKHISCMF